ncbi:hypothetical protein RBH29_17345, partial [Herbivorax sp. ANBcel31]|uniref:hypothetical protein n=1 Tax=Herbivorax sp. ANBcel31 TaxID=3069754 RepID=UPI0027B688D0
IITSETNEPPSLSTDFYVTEKGDVIPATGYRYMDSEYAEQTFSTNSAPGSYFGFEKFDSAADAQNAFQIAPKWNDCMMRGEFDTIQVIDDIYIPTTYGNTTNVPEPFAVSYSEYGEGGTYQMKVDEMLNFRDLQIIDK